MPYYASQGSAWINIGLTPITENCYNCSRQKQIPIFMNLAAKEVAVIGDQIFTDVLGGNRMGLYTILVTPISDKEFIWTRLMRRLERLVLNYLKRKNMIH